MNQSNNNQNPGKALLITLSVIYVLVHLIFINQYDYFRDELYYIACGNHLAFGYVDQPPFVALIAFISTRLFGESLFAIRIFSVLAGGMTVFVTGKITKQLGGSLFAQALSGLMVMFAPVYLFMFHILSMNSFDILFWALAIFVLVKIITTGNSKHWLWFGVVIGIGFENKISILFLLFGLAVGLILTPNRKYLKDKYFWYGAAIAFLISLPYLIWEIVISFPTLEFMRNASSFKNASISPLNFLKEQMLDMHPISLLISLGGLYFLFFTKSGKQFRMFGWMYLAIFIFLMSTRSKVYYISPVYPLLFSFGAIAIESFVRRFNQKWIRPVSVTLLILLGAVTAPMA
ncbi:glycosyltransferase family 39 protein, partial [bacterium BMS3Abin03]|nr:glycosyltransferase family 39 protein [bacterium BMS3Abin03]